MKVALIAGVMLGLAVGFLLGFVGDSDKDEARFPSKIHALKECKKVHDRYHPSVVKSVNFRQNTEHGDYAYDVIYEDGCEIVITYNANHLIKDIFPMIVR